MNSFARQSLCVARENCMRADYSYASIPLRFTHLAERTKKSAARRQRSQFLLKQFSGQTRCCSDRISPRIKPNSKAKFSLVPHSASSPTTLGAWSGISRSS